MTEEQIQAVKDSDERDEEAMELVHDGGATMIEFSRDHIIGQCGKERRNLEQGSADEVGGWQKVANLVNWEALSDDLLCVDFPIIVPGEMKDESVIAFIDQMQCALAAVIANEDMEANFTSEE